MSEPRSHLVVPEWGSDLGNPIALLNREPAELGRAPGLEFVPGHDDLDAVLVAVLRAPSGRDYALVRHVNSPSPGTEVLTRVPLAQAAIIADDLRELLHVLGLGQDAIEWVAPLVGATLSPAGSTRQHQKA